METVIKQMAEELITEKRFPMLSARYDSEQEELTEIFHCYAAVCKETEMQFDV